MARIYVASSWRNQFQPNVVQELRKIGHQVYDFRNPPNGRPGFAWSEIDSDWQARSARRYRELLITSPIAAAGFLSDLRGMQWADTCLLVLPCGRSAHLEAGWFCGQGKRCIILTRDECRGECGSGADEHGGRCKAMNGQPHPVTKSKVVLTVGHLNHTPEDCRDEVLRHWCQRCHLRYDQVEHQRNARMTRSRKVGQGDFGL